MPYAFSAPGPGRHIVALLMLGICLTVSTTWLHAEAMPTLQLDGREHQPLHAPTEWRAGAASLAEVRQLPFVPLQPTAANRGITTETFWLRVRLVNQGPEAHSWVIHHETSYLDTFDIFYRDGGAEWQRVPLSDGVRFDQRPLDFRKLGWEHTTPAGGFTDLYLRLRHLQPDTITLNVEWASADTFRSRALKHTLVAGGFYGMMAVILLVALIGAAALRQKVWLHYALFIACSMLLWAALQGFAFQYLWPNLPRWHNASYHLIFLLVPLAAFQFSKNFLQTARLAPRIHRLISVLQLGMVASMLLRLTPYYEALLWISYTALGSLTLLPLLGWFAWRQGLRYARWYTGAWTIYSVGLLFSLLSAGGSLLGWGMAPLVWAQVASLLEALLLLLGLGERLLEWERERQFALEAAYKDTLTGLGNRRRLLQAFDELQLRRQHDEGEQWFLAMIDLDSFKSINDSYGHDAGDRILREVARLLMRHTRSADVPIRYGGEEFAVLLQAPSMTAAHRMLDRIRVLFSEQPTHYGELSIEHSFSAGLVEVPLELGQLSPQHLIRCADEALYRAKTSGRNRIVVVDTPPRAT